VLLAVTLDQARTYALIGVGVAVVLAILVARFVQKLVFKAIGVLLLAGIAFGLWTQRQSLSDCAERVQADPTGATCTFFGQDVTVPGA
jgi:uncharacterized membrane protein